MNIGIAFAAAALAPAPAASPPVDAALANAAGYCQAVVAERKATAPVPAGAIVHTDAGVPDLVARVAATKPMIRMFGVAAYVHFPATEGQVWAVRAQQSVACNIVVTAVPGDAGALAVSFLEALSAQGWQIMSSLTATPARPLWRHSFVKRVPKADSPRFGLSLAVQGPHPTASTEDGVQMELSFMGGDNFQAGASPR